MPFVTSAEKARSERKAIDVLGQEYFLSPYVGSAPKRGQYVPGNEKNDDGLPQGFLVEQPPNSVTRPHFHNMSNFNFSLEVVRIWVKRQRRLFRFITLKVIHLMDQSQLVRRV